MNKREQFDSAPIAPIYTQAEPNDPIEYGSVLIETAGKGGNDKLKARATFREKFSHEHDFQMIVPEPTAPAAEANDAASFFTKMSQAQTNIMGEHKRFQFSDNGTAFEAFCVHAASERSVYHPVHTPMQTRPPSKTIAKAVFHLFNWPDLSGPDSYVLQTGAPPHFGWRACGRFRMECDGWSITVAEFENTDALVKKLKETGGYAITHVGQVERTDEQPFSTEQLDKLLDCLGCFFSFVLGQWSRPSLTVGFDEVGDRVFEHWGMHQTTIGHHGGGNSFFDRHHDEIFPSLFPGFWQRCSAQVTSCPTGQTVERFDARNHRPSKRSGSPKKNEERCRRKRTSKRGNFHFGTSI